MHRRPAVLTALVLGLALSATLVLAQAMADHARPDYVDWTRLNPQRNFIASAHPTAKDVFVNEVGAAAALERNFPFPVGSELVKETLDPATLTVTVITAMRKVAGFDPANGDWQYAMFERQADGTFGGTWADVGSELHGMCVSCHTRAAANDYAFLTYTGD